MLHCGLAILGMDEWERKSKDEATLIDKFKDHFGSHPYVCSKIWEDMEPFDSERKLLQQQLAMQQQMEEMQQQFKQMMMAAAAGATHGGGPPPVPGSQSEEWMDPVDISDAPVPDGAHSS